MPNRTDGTMPVTAALAKRMSAQPLSGLTILHINHLLNDVLELNGILRNLGAELVYVPVIYGQKTLPKDLPYTLITAYHAGDGFQIYHNERIVEVAPDNFEAAVRRSIILAYQHAQDLAQQRASGKILILEDGGYHFDALAEAPTELDRTLIIGAIEQTAAGMRRARVHLLQPASSDYPVLSVARSRLKVRFENYFIARRIVEETALLMYEEEEFLDLKDVLVIGYGIIGRPIAQLLSKLGCRVVVSDANAQVLHTATCDGFETLKRSSDLAAIAPLVVMGATGKASFTLELLANLLKSSNQTIYLVSGSSKRVEFAEVIEFFEGTAERRQILARRYSSLGEIVDVRLEPAPCGIIYHFRTAGQERALVLIAEGYPVNFYRPLSQSLPARVIDLINAELLLLTHYLWWNHPSLYRQLYLLGHDYLPNLGISEEELMELWTDSNRVSALIRQTGIWQVLSPHPNEHWLTTFA